MTINSNSFSLKEHIPLVAIIRGVKPEEVIDVAQVLIDEGFTMIEVPLNSPDALESISKLVKYFGCEKYLIGAGTVTTAEEAKKVVATGANLIVSPNVDQDVLEVAKRSQCISLPGVVTPTEAFNAIKWGATGLKLFPIDMVGIDGLKALKAVLPKDTLLFPVGGINPTPESMEPYIKLGVNGFGLGSALYKPTNNLDEVRVNARQYIESFKAVTQ